MATTCARFTEIEQFNLEQTDPEGVDQDRWAFIERVKNREYLQPIILHGMQTVGIDPVKAMLELRKRVRAHRAMYEMHKDTFWYTETGNLMRYEDIRRAAQQLMSDAGISDRRAYHIKHATISWLHHQNVPTDQIIRFIRHALGSTTYMEYYLSEDLGKKCTSVIENTAFLGNRRGGDPAPHGKEVAEDERETGNDSYLEAIVESFDTAVAAPIAQLSPKHSHARRTHRN
jgi:hypothetical protein